MIITVTLNPAIDETVEVRRLTLADTNRVLSIRRDIGGKGINVARVLKELGYEPLAAGFAPGNFGRMIEDQLVDAGIGCDFVTYPGETRTNIHIVDRETHADTVLAAAGAPVPPEAVRHLRSVNTGLRRIQAMGQEELMAEAKAIGAPFELVQQVHKEGRLPVVTFVAGGIATPADAALMMQLGAEGVFVGSGIFKSDDPAPRARAIVKATTHYKDAAILAEVSKGLGEAMAGTSVSSMKPEDLLATRGW